MAPPSYPTDQCPLCPQHSKGACWGCGKQIPQYATPSGAVNGQPTFMEDGFDSASVNHYHFDERTGKAGLRIIKAVLCRECYLVDYNQVYPERGLTIDELPKEVRFA